MKKHSEETPDWNDQRKRIIGLGESSIRKNYFPELQQKILELEKKNKDLNAAYEDLSIKEEELRQNYEELSTAEGRLRESEEKYRAVVSFSNDGIVIIQDGFLQFVNPKAAEMLSGAVDEFVNLPYLEFIHSREHQKIDEIYQKRMHGEPVSSVNESVLVNKKQELVDIELNANIITYRGKLADLVYIRDIRERKRSQKALEQAKKKLNLLNYVTFNEIKNKIFTISGYQHFIKSKIGNAESPILSFLLKEDDLLGDITESLKFAQTYQDLGLKIARWQNVNQVFLMAISHLDFIKIKHHVMIGDLEIFADPLLEQVFQILADNILVHGKTATQVTLRYEQNHDESVTIFVEDNGVGLPAEIKESIFLPEFQKTKSVGLFLAGEILEITEISIRETGTPGKGARFEMTVPKDGYRFGGCGNENGKSA